MKHPALEPLAVERLSRYCSLLAAAPLSLTAVRGDDALWERHVADALTALPLLASLPPGELVDVGSGGGSPGIPLAVALGRPVVLLEANRRKADFLASALAALDLPGRAVAERAETHGRGPGRDAYAIVVARALAPPAVAAEWCLPLVRPGGRLVVFAGEADAAEVRLVAAELGGALREVVATGERRRLLAIDKLVATPERFPRRIGVAGKRPLPSLRSSP